MLEIYQTGYKVNDAYTSYYLLDRPSQLSKAQVEYIKKQNDGSPVSTELVTIGADGKFSREIPVRENDVFLVSLKHL
jgi:xylan 1,4-beta-xylosidase